MNNNIKENTIISIAGMVGVGKSTLSKKLAQRLNFKLSLEEVDNNPYLDKYYQDFSRWGFHLQIFFLTSRFKELKKMFEQGSIGYIQDRTIFEDLEIFAKMNYDNQTMSKEDYETYKALFESMVMTPFVKKPDIIIYLDGELEDILQRLSLRGRDMEVATNQKYWEELYTRYQEWISTYYHTPVLKINIKDYDVEDEASIDKIIQKIALILKEYNEATNI
ncbi:MAG: deoxynucleoside kinase [Mycoplasmatales bacterium]